VELGVLGPLQVRKDGAPVAIPGAKPRAILTMLGLYTGSVVSADTLVELLWGDDPPRTADKALQTHISSLRRALGDGFVVTEGTGWTLSTTETDASRYRTAAKTGRAAAAAGDTGQAVARFEEALALWRGIPELPDTARGTSEKTRWVEGHAALVEDRADALLATGRAAEIVGELEAAVAEAPLRERRWGQLMLALYRAGRQGEALGAYQRARSLLADELGVDPGPELRRLEAAVVAQDSALEVPAAQQLPTVMRAVTFLLTDIEGSTATWEAEADAMAVALARHDEVVEQVVTSRGGRLIKTRGEGDATFSVFERPSAAAAAAIELQDAIRQEPWELMQPMRIRVALHTGEVEFRDGDYFGRAVNRAARLRSLAAGGQILCSGATAELVIDSLPDDVVLADLGTRQLRNLARPEHVFELRLETADDIPQEPTADPPIERPPLPAVLAGPGPFVGRGRELERLLSAWQTTLAEGMRAVLIAGEPGVGKTRLAGEWSRQAYEQGAVVIYGRCDEDLGAPYQPFAEALRSLVPSLGAGRLRGMRGVEALLPLVPGLTDVVPDIAAPTRADPDTERYALFDAVVALLGVASASAPVILILDDLHWASKPTLLLLRHLLRFGEHARVQIVGTYRSTDLDRSHPLAAMLADLHRDGSADRIALGGLDENDVTAYVTEAGYDDEELARALASVTGGNPFFLIEALRHVDESGGHWDPSTLPQGVREAVSRRLSRLPAATNKALAAAAVVGSRFAVELVERVVDQDLVDAFDEACQAGILIEEPGGRYRFNHAIVRQSLLAELASVRRMRLHQRIAATLENEPGADDELLAELAYHYFECAWAGNAAKAVEYCRRAADQEMTRLAYEGAAELYDRALHALEELDDELPDRADQTAELLVARCEALLAAGDVASAMDAVSQLQAATRDSARLASWAACFDGQLSMLIHPERLNQIEAAVAAAAEKLAELDDAAGEAKAHTVRAACLARLGRIGDCEIALDNALTAARSAREHRRVNAVLAGAPIAALWGPNPVPRAGGRCLDVVRLLRITTDSPAVEATSTRCQAVLEAFRGRVAAARRMIDSARRTVTELGLRHALLEVEQFAGIVELVVDDPAAAEPHLRQAYNGFRRMHLDTDIAETAALLARACLALGRDAEADELCTESERLAGHALKPSIAWRTVRAQLLSRRGDHDEARRIAEAAVSLAERTDLLVDHGDACLALATVLETAGDVAGARDAAERAVGLYERKGAAALADKARRVVGAEPAPAPAASAPPSVKPDTAAVRASERVMAAIGRGDWDEFERLSAPPEASIESRRKVVGFNPNEFPAHDVIHQTRCDLENGAMRANHVVIAARGERLALARVVLSTADTSPGAPRDEFLQLYGIDAEGRIALQVWFDLEDMDAALAELDATHARFEQERLHTRRLENAASRVSQHFWTYFLARDWEALTAILADNASVEDRRPVVNYGLMQGSDSVVESLRVAADTGVKQVSQNAIAIRGDRLALVQIHFSSHDQRLEAFQSDFLVVVEVDADERSSANVVYDVNQLEAAIADLDARYLAGEAAAHAHTWSVVAAGYAALNRHELPPTPANFVNIDHRRGGSAFAPGELLEYVRVSWDDSPHNKIHVEAVHRLNNLGAVVTSATSGASVDGVNAEWREIGVVTVDGDMINRTELFDETDPDAALSRFAELGQTARRLENAASRADDRFNALFADRRWDEIGALLADDIRVEDRRRGLRREAHGRAAELAELQAIADVGTKTMTSRVLAIRGGRLALVRTLYSGRDQRPDAFHTEVLRIAQIDADERVAAWVAFDLDDFDGAIAELDARYLAGEAAAQTRTWSAIAGVYAGFNRRELPPTTRDWVNIDHRRGAAFAPGDMTAYILATFDDAQEINPYIEAVHRLSHLGAVITHAAHGTSQQGFEAAWRYIAVVTVEGDMINRCELFDEADLDAALARFEELSRAAPQLENAATRAYQRLQEYFAARDWDAITGIVADDISAEDRRHVVNAGLRQGRDAMMAELSAYAEIGARAFALEFIAIRGDRLVLSRGRPLGRAGGPEAFSSDICDVLETDADGRIVARVIFDSDDIDAAFAELEARYLAGEAGSHAHTWSVITKAFGAVNRHELPELMQGWVNVDHRRAIAFAPGEMNAYIHATLNDARVRVYVEVVHRLSDLGAVTSHAAHNTSQHGFEAEWRQICISTIDGELINRCEIFDESDLEAALARFEELQSQRRRLENAASQLTERYWKHFAERDWDAMAGLLAKGISTDDRRTVVGAGIRRGRDAEIAEVKTTAGLGTKSVTAIPIAVRGQRLALMRIHFAGRDQRPEAFRSEILAIVELDADNLMAARLVFDAHDIEAAFEELEVRYVAGEAAAQAQTWSIITAAVAALNRHEIPATTPDYVIFDQHLQHTVQGAGRLSEYMRASWDLAPDFRIHIEAVHELRNVGAVITIAVQGSSQEGFEVEWRRNSILTVESNRISRYEGFDESDLDAALARFDELHPTAPRLENAASRAYDRFNSYLAARDWDAMAQMVADDVWDDDRRRVVSGGVRRGRDAQFANLRAVVDVGVKNFESVVIATRGERLALTRARVSGDQRPEAFGIELLCIIELNTDNRISAGVMFDLDDIDAAFEELETRYLAGEAGPYARTWSLVAEANAALYRREVFETTPDWVNIDHRRVTAFAPGDLIGYVRAGWDVNQATSYIEAVHRLDNLGAVVTNVAHGASRDGFDAEWRTVSLGTFEGQLCNRCELFDEEDLDAALARFDELNRQIR